MHSRCFHPHLFILPMILALAWPLSTGCLAQAAPRAPGIEITSATAISETQLAELKVFVTYWSAVFLDSQSTPEKVQEARNFLGRPLQGTNIGQTVSQSFRFEYSTLLIPEMEKAIDRGKDNQHAAVNAIIVLSGLGSNKALTALLSRCDQLSAAKVPWQIRLHAVMACENLIKSPALEAKNVIDAAKRLRDLARNEDKPLVLLHLLEAIDAADNNNLKAEQNESVRMALVDAIVTVTDRISAMQDEPQSRQMAEAVASTLKPFRDKYTTKVPLAERTAIAAKMGPALGHLLAVANRNWSTAHADPDMQKTYGMIVAITEGFLPLIDAQLRGQGKSPQTTLKEGWNQGKKEKFDADVKLWHDALSDKAYVKGPG